MVHSRSLIINLPPLHAQLIDTFTTFHDVSIMIDEKQIGDGDAGEGGMEGVD